MTPAQILIKEHTLILEGLNLFEIGINKFQDHDVNKTFWNDLFLFFTGYVDKCHHTKEEKIFSPNLLKIPDPHIKSEIQQLLTEHSQGRNFLKAIEQWTNQHYGGVLSAKENLIANSKGYIELLRFHIRKENVWFVKIEPSFSPEQLAKITQEFDKTEVEEISEGIHDKNLEILENARIVLRI